MFTLALALTRSGVGPSLDPVQKLRARCANCGPAPALRRTSGRRTRLTALLLAGIGSVLLSGCWERADARAEARELMSSLNAVSDEGSFRQRSAALTRLSQLPLHFERHAQTRDVCSAAHKGLLEAEVAQAEARRALSSSSKDGAQIPLEHTQAQSIAADIERSNRALATAKARFPECERAMRDLLKEAH